MNEHEWQEIIGTIGLFTLVIIVVLGLTWHFTGGRRARRELAHEREYRDLAEAATRAQERTEQQLTELRQQVTDMGSRVDSLERILKEVE